ncbi:ABC transporter ATP-binding protein [Yoonia sediminilitoris]|uniref:NitT/TauT family transport system ATP-binding protein n=1 Tax=Yoonia sediminilitoris TaxID=1286148 RepID=A0A2T6KQV8_9RHOB|nr:ABC transporter ATP-binding protein [Yoonia sediminilitoris]PUB18937.1 NitT/TauT family transport system ATP-binding protein [Yoonia sediminilitoris]RCW99105.1 NitT/TauT family transport system ATP-binding protein [Yoonia sediminilitoris]
MQHDHPSAERAQPVAKSGDADVRIAGVAHTYAVVDGPVLSGIDLTIAPGSVVALIGRSGSGKSTLLHIIAGLIRPTDGAVRIGGQAVQGPSPRWVMMFQAPSLFPWMSVAQNAGLGLRYAGQKDGAAERVADVLDLVDLASFADRNVQDLSGGQQQRVALARSLAPSPDVLLLDEPFSALDMFTRQSMQTDVRAIAKRLGLTMILVTHDVSEAVLMADRAVFLKSGAGVIAGDTDINLDDRARNADDPTFDAELARLNEIYTGLQTA